MKEGRCAMQCLIMNVAKMGDNGLYVHLWSNVFVDKFMFWCDLCVGGRAEDGGTRLVFPCFHLLM